MSQVNFVFRRLAPPIRAREIDTFPYMEWRPRRRSVIGALGSISLIALTGSIAHAQATVLVGPFLPNSGNWDLLPNGGFETGTTADWGAVGHSSCNWQASSTESYQGAYSAVANTTTSFSGSGYALAQTISGLTIGQSYMLSGFFYTASLTTGDLYLDLNDIPDDPNTVAPDGVSQWQFAYSAFTATTTTETVRLVRDTDFLEPGAPTIVGQQGFIDDVAVTPLSSFVAPTVSGVAPEPCSAALLVIPAFVAADRRRKTTR